MLFCEGQKPTNLALSFYIHIHNLCCFRFFFFFFEIVSLGITDSPLKYKNVFKNSLDVCCSFVSPSFDLAIQWLCNADKSSHDPRLRLKYVPILILHSLLW
jgi:hypothetical protein